MPHGPMCFLPRDDLSISRPEVEEMLRTFVGSACSGKSTIMAHAGSSVSDGMIIGGLLSLLVAFPHGLI